MFEGAFEPGAMIKRKRFGHRGRSKNKQAL